MTPQTVQAMQICECGEKNVAQAIEIFQNTSLPFVKAKKLVTECQKTCCKSVLSKLFDMTYFGVFDYDEIARLIEARRDRSAS